MIRLQPEHFGRVYYEEIRLWKLLLSPDVFLISVKLYVAFVNATGIDYTQPDLTEKLFYEAEINYNVYDVNRTKCTVIRKKQEWSSPPKPGNMERF